MTRSAWPEVALSAVATIERRGVSPDEIEAGTTFVGLENMTSDGGFIGQRGVGAGELGSQKFKFDEGHVLYGKLRPYLAKIAAPNFSGVCSTDILPIRPGPRLDRGFLLRYLRQPSSVATASSLASGANLPRLSPSVLCALPIPVPPMEEQRRIAAVLDKADELRAKRRAAIALLDTLTESIFLDMFGDPLSNPMAWPAVTLGELVSMPLRNGVSPATNGSIEEEVLTLSAITRGSFDATAVKRARFTTSPPASKRVDAEDLLICRGNGNIELVGRGRFSAVSLPTVVFPDTMIAARVPPSRSDPRFIEHIWSTAGVRRQIASLARTTNGTFKVNQEMLEGVEMFDPPLALQQAFGKRVELLADHRSKAGDDLAQLDELFASLQDRAFRGEL